jgi:hypothetical protein
MLGLALIGLAYLVLDYLGVFKWIVRFAFKAVRVLVILTVVIAGCTYGIGYVTPTEASDSEEQVTLEMLLMGEQVTDV